MRPTFSFHQGMPTRNLFLTIQVLGALLPWLPCLSAADPITPSGLHTQVSDPVIIGPEIQYDITGGTRPGGAAGTNLFHSFGDFGVPVNNIANFLNGVSFDLNGNQLPAGLQTSNILARVTGTNGNNPTLSSIDGTIQTTGFENANLFLMNPAGFLFGPNATVNVGGMVAFTSADYLKLTDGVLFNKTPNVNQDALLSAAPVAAFGFIGSNPGAITVKGSQFTVTEGTGISLVGGNVTIQSGTLPALLSAPAGRINLASAASPGEFLAGTLDQAPNINGQSFGNLGTIQISQKSLIDASGDGSGTVVIRGGRFVLDESTVSTNFTVPGVGPPGFGIDIVVSQDAVIQNGAILLQTAVSGDPTPGVQHGDVRVKADRIEIIGSEDFENFPLTGIISEVAPDSTVKGGDITLEANTILIRDLGTGTTLVETTTMGDGSAGKISLRTGGNLEVDGGIIDSFAVFGSGHAGDIELRSTQGNILMTNLTFVSSQASPFSTGNSGAIVMSAPGGDILLADMTQISNAARGIGALGGIEIDANNLTLLNSGISGDNLTTQPAGNITVTLSGTLNVGGTDFNSFIQTLARGPAPAADLNVMAKGIVITDGARLSTETFSSGPGGRLNILTDNLQLTNGGQIRSGSTKQPPGSGGLPPAVPSGAGGTVTIQGLASPAESVLIDGTSSGIITNTEGSGAGGNILVNANSVNLQNGATVSASSTGQIDNPGNAGNIDITATNGFTMMQNSAITTQAGQGASGGDIKVTTAPSATVLLEDSRISASVADGPGGGGNISIDPQFVILQNSQILARAAQGQGGAITITANLFLPDANSIVNADSGSGLHGTVTIQSPNAPGSGQVQPLGKSPLQATSLLNQHCASLAGGEFSSFTVAGRDSLPVEPTSWLASPLATLNAGMGLGVKAEGVRPVVRDEEPEGETALLSLRQIAPPGFLTQAFAVDWSTGCTS